MKTIAFCFLMIVLNNLYCQSIYDIPEYKAFLETGRRFLIVGRYSQALIEFEEALKVQKKSFGENHITLAEPYKFIGITHYASERYEEAKTALESSLQIQLNHFENRGIVDIYQRLITVCDKLNIQKSDIAQRTMEVTPLIKKADYLRFNSRFYLQAGQYDIALEYCDAELKVLEPFFEDPHIRTAYCYNRKADVLLNKKDVIQSRKLYHKALSLCLNPKDSSVISILRFNVGETYHYEGNYVQAISWYKKALIESRHKTLTHFKVHEGIGDAYLCLGDLDKAILHFKESQKFRNESFLKSEFIPTRHEHSISQVFLYTHFEHWHEQFLNFRLAKIHTMDGNYEIADSLWKNSLPQWIENLKISSVVRNIFPMYRISDEEHLYPFFEFATKYQNPTTLELLADLQLNIKSIFLDAEKIHKAVKKKGKGEYRKLFAHSPIKWKDIKEKLDSNHAIIDFISFPDDVSKCNAEPQYIYYAILTRKNLPSPQIIRITDEETLSELLQADEGERPNFIYDRNKRKVLYKTLWQPLELYMKDIETVYISPTGILHRVPFESLQTTESAFLITKYKFHYYSAIRDMLQEKTQKTNYKDIVLLGHILYDSSEKDKYNMEEKTFVFDTINTRNRIQPLQGTLEEVMKIDNISKAVGLNRTMLTIDRASEDAVRHYVRRRAPSIFHFATHGIFLTRSKKRHQKITSTHNQLSAAHNPLQRSALMLYDANKTWTKGGHIGSDNDGILTALEVTALELQKTDLVVLSACSTGLGSIYNAEEGILGLQRAFKLAGVNHVVASLWDVDDEATKDLMVRFYENLLKEKQDPATALRNAKNYFRNKGYKPVDWAGFILIE